MDTYHCPSSKSSPPQGHPGEPQELMAEPIQCYLGNLLLEPP